MKYFDRTTQSDGNSCQVVPLVLLLILPRTDLPGKDTQLCNKHTCLEFIYILVHVKEDVASSLSPLSDVLFLGLSHIAVVVAPPQPLRSTAHITDVVPCNTQQHSVSANKCGYKDMVIIVEPLNMEMDTIGTMYLSFTERLAILYL